MLSRPSRSVALLVAVLLGTPALAQVSHPESVGFSTEGLKAFQQEMRAYGVQDLESKKPVTKDTIFRIASMTKPIVGVAMMMLWEEGKWTLDDSVSKGSPQVRPLSRKRVYAALVDPKK